MIGKIFTRFVLDAFVKPFFAILFFIGFGGVFVFFGFQDVRIQAEKDINGKVTMDIVRTHFWVVKTVHRHVEGAQGAEIETKDTDDGYLSGAVIKGDNSSVSVLSGFSNTDERLKRKIINQVNTFLRDGSEGRFDQSFHLRNVFGWFGLPFFIIGVLGALCWPFNIIKIWQKAGRNPNDFASGKKWTDYCLETLKSEGFKKEEKIDSQLGIRLQVVYATPRNETLQIHEIYTLERDNYRLHCFNISSSERSYGDRSIIFCLISPDLRLPAFSILGIPFKGHLRSMVGAVMPKVDRSGAEKIAVNDAKFSERFALYGRKLEHPERFLSATLINCFVNQHDVGLDCREDTLIFSSLFWDIKTGVELKGEYDRSKMQALVSFIENVYKELLWRQEKI